ncbi:MAG: Pr6Pr family membrane protein [Bifidobacteriaceae bacterium]|jgi:hypothetical protein|nr:Pr6Pr family membrane protein [Bifidobacteriaceae bacterium]
MIIKSKLVIYIYRIAAALLAGVGIYLNYYSFDSNIFDLLSYFTILSNLLGFLYMIYGVWCLAKNKLENLSVKGAAMLYLMVTFLIFFFVLVPSMQNGSDSNYLTTPANALVHYIMPWLMFFDFILFSPKGKFSKLDPLKWTIFPFAYFAFCIIRAQFTSFQGKGTRWPYFFIDFDSQAFSQVMVNVACMIVLFVLLGYIFYLLDYLLNKFFVNRKSHHTK